MSDKNKAMDQVWRTINLIRKSFRLRPRNIDEADVAGLREKLGIAATDEIKTRILEGVFPVGAIYINLTNSDNPGTILGFGSWSPVEGVSLIGAGTHTDRNGDELSFASGEEYGEYGHTLTIDEMPSHNHDYAKFGAGGYQSGASSGSTSGTKSTTTETGGGLPHNIIQPSLAVYMWKRTA
ncbi:phage baseplate protein [Thalassospira marina]|uniref:Baseplate structural protein Gp10 C-terminal domain-containing protein n=1 Tax=Thalassospira marina TaxID=2048283 RepID=A0A2N3KX41_9PROT|nr:hypothetical protein [Thalassospira marina]PKR55060.1 hypothetical protein COO20_06645 [Thalassospira marina]